MPSTPPNRTGVPLLVDNSVANTIDFHVAATDFLKVVQTYLNEVATSYAHNYSLLTADPITSEANFFRDLNNGTLNLTTKASGNNENVKGSLTEKINTQLGANETFKTDENGVVESRVNNGVVEYLVINNKTQTTRWVAVEQDVLTQVKETTSQLSSAYSADKLSDEFVLYWMEKFRTAHQAVKTAYKALVTDPTQDYFSDFSDTMGSITRLSENIDSTLLPLSDPDMDLIGLLPNAYHPTLDDKIPDALKMPAIQLSKLNNALYRNNLVKVLTVAATATVTHGENLVTDEAHYKRLQSILDSLLGSIANTLGKVARVMFYIRTLPSVNNQVVSNFSYTAAIENSLLQIDILQNKITDLQSQQTLQTTLSAQP